MLEPHTPIRLTRTLALAAVLALAGCSDRKVEPDYSEYIEDSCMATCPVTTECDPDSTYATTEACIEGCLASDRWDDLNQCDSRRIELSLCIGQLSCEEYQAYLMTVGDEPLYPEGFACADQLTRFYQCDAEQPFEPPE